MTSQPPPSDDPLASLARKAETATRAQDAARADKVAEREAARSARRRLARWGSVAVLIAVLVGALTYAGPRMMDPYYGVDPLEDPLQAKAYVAGLLDAVWSWRSRNGGEFPATLEQAVSPQRLPPAGSDYRVEYRVEGGVPVVSLVGRNEPVIVRGAGK